MTSLTEAQGGFKPIHENPLILDFTEIKYPSEIHLMLKHKFGLPSFYGENWDALWDSLRDAFDQNDSLVVELKGFERMKSELQEYCLGMFSVFRDIHREFPQITFKKFPYDPGLTEKLRLQGESMTQEDLAYGYKPIADSHIVLNFSACRSMHDIHMTIKDALGYPDYYEETWPSLDNSLDGFCFLRKPTAIDVKRPLEMDEELTEEYEYLLWAFKLVHDDNPQITFTEIG